MNWQGLLFPETFPRVVCDPGSEADPLRWFEGPSGFLRLKRSSICSKRAHVNAHFMKQFAQQAHRIMTSSMEKERLISPLGAPGEEEKKIQPHVLKKQN